MTCNESKEEEEEHLNEPDVKVLVDQEVPAEDLERVFLAVGVELLPHPLERRHHDLPGVAICISGVGVSISGVGVSISGVGVCISGVRVSISGVGVSVRRSRRCFSRGWG